MKELNAGVIRGSISSSVLPIEHCLYFPLEGPSWLGWGLRGRQEHVNIPSLPYVSVCRGWCICRSPFVYWMKNVKNIDSVCVCVRIIARLCDCALKIESVRRLVGGLQRWGGVTSFVSLCIVLMFVMIQRDVDLVNIARCLVYQSPRWQRV